jgi:hypothetical protein
MLLSTSTVVDCLVWHLPALGQLNRPCKLVANNTRFVWCNLHRSILLVTLVRKAVIRRFVVPILTVLYQIYITVGDTLSKYIRLNSDHFTLKSMLGFTLYLLLQN